MKLLPMALSLLATATATATATAAASDTDLRRCRAIAEGTQRLACYDALSLAPAAPPAVVPAPAAAAAATFGLERQPPEMQEITSHIPGIFEGWQPKTRFRLANGQVWQVSDDSSAVYDLRDPKVTVRRAALSGFVLDIDGARRSPRVRRVE